MECSVKRLEDGQIDKVFAPNGKESILFKSLNDQVKDKEEALKLWAQTYTPAFKSWFGDWEAIEKAKTFRDKIKKLWVGAFDTNIEQFLFEFAQQITSSESEASGTLDVIGEDLFDIAIKMFPNTKVGDKFESKISKVVDENGEPLVVYHGTANIIDKFEKATLNYGLGIYTTNSKEYADTYRRVDINKPYAGEVGVTMPFFINIKNPLNVDNYGTISKIKKKPEGHDGIIFNEPNISKEREIVAFEPNQIKSIYNEGGFDPNDEGIYKKEESKSGVKILIGKLQSEGKLGKRLANRTYEVNADDYNLIDKEQKAFQIAQEINKQSGKELVKAAITKDGNPVIVINKETYNIIQQLDPQDIQAYQKFLNDNLYTNKNEPVTTELINNAALLSKDLGREDLANMARLINKYLDKNPTLSTRIIDSMDTDGAKAYYSRVTNRITFARNTIGTDTLEMEAGTVLHELLHALTFQPWFKLENQVPLTQEEKVFKGIVDGYYNYFSSLKKADLNNYYFRGGPEEFLMGVMFDSAFRDHLEAIANTETIKESPLLRFLKDLLKGFLNLFGIGIREDTIENINPETFHKSMFDALSEYLDKMDKVGLWNGLKEQGRNYGLSFAVTAEQDYNAEREKRSQVINDDMKEKIKRVIDKSILSIKSFGSTIRTRFPESQEGFQAIFRQLKKMEDPEYNIDEVDFFFDFTSEISAIMKMANDKISKLESDTVITDNDYKLKEFESIVSAIRNFDPIMSEIEGVKIRLENLGLQESVKDINLMINNRSRIEKVYSMGIFPLVTTKLVEVLSTGSRKAIEISNQKIDELTKRIAIANKHNNSARAKQLEEEIKKEQKVIDNQFTLNTEKIENLLRGKMGDSNIYQTWSMAAISNSNPLVAGLQKFIRDNVGEIAPKVLELQNSIQSEVEKYEKQSGVSIDHIDKFNLPLIDSYETISGKDDKDNFTYDKTLTLLNEFNGKHIQEFQKFKRNLTDLYAKKREIENQPNVDPVALAEVVEKIRTNQKERQQFVNDYIEQPYLPEVHEALDMLKEDLGGFTAWDYMGPLISRIEDLQLAIDQENDESKISDLYNQLEDQNFELRRLSSLYEKSSDTNEFKVAEQLKKRSKLLSTYSNFILTDKGKLHFENEVARMSRKLDRKEITPQRYERWLEDNTVTELTPAYWTEKKRILTEINEVADLLGYKSQDNEELRKLYDKMEDITKAHRDSEGIINGQGMSEQELKDVKFIEQSIEDFKDQVANIMGITKLERMELANLYDQLGEINDKILVSFGSDITMLESLRSDVEQRIGEINDKKKKHDKKLIERYFKLMKELAKLDEHSDTKYYMDELKEQTEKFKWLIDVSKMPNRFFTEGNGYNKIADQWYEVGKNGSVAKDTGYIEDIYRQMQGSAELASSQWWKDNHITRIKFLPNPNYDGTLGSSSGEWTYVEDPTYAWRQTRPKLSKYIAEGQPSIKYKKRTIKEQYVNKNYKEDITGNVQPKIIGAKDDRFINKKYFDLMNSKDPKDIATAGFLKYLTETYLKAQESIPIKKRPGYKLPSIRRSEVERFLSQSLKENTDTLLGRVGNMARIWNDDVKINEQDKDILFGYSDDFTGIVPMKFLGKIQAQDQSIDLARSILAFTIESLKRDQLVKSLPLANAVKDIVNNPDNRPVKTKKGVVETVKRKFLPKGTELAKRAQTSNTALQINEMIKSEIYGENMKDVPGAKLVNSTLGLGAKLMLGFNFVSSVQNYANAFTQSIMETESKTSRNFTMSNFFEAQKIYYGHMDELMSDLGKYGNKSYINQFFDYFGGINFKLFSKNNRSLVHGTARELVGALSIPNQITEHMLNYHMGIAIALNYRVKAKVDGKDTMVRIFDAFTLKDRNLIIKPGVEVTEADRKEMISRLNSSSRRINGEYGDKILADKYILGKLALFMNRYVIPFVVKRYGSRNWDIQDGVRDEGYWKLFGKTILKDIKLKSIPIISGWKYYTSDEKTAIIKATTEFGFSVMFFLLLNAMGGADDKKLKNNSVLTNNMIYALKGIQQQNEAFMPVPGVGFDDLFRKIQNPFPILGKVKNLIAIIQDGSHTLYYEMGLPGVDRNDVFYSKSSGWHKQGDLKVMADFQKLIGIPQHVMNYLYPDQAIKSLDAISRIK